MYIFRPTALSAFLTFFALCAFAQQSDRDIGFASYQAADFSKSAQHFQNAVSIEPNDKLSWLYLGAARLHLKDESGARTAFNAWGKIKKRDEKGEPFAEEEYQITRKSYARSNEGLRRKYDLAKAKLLVELRSDGTIGFVHVLINTAFEWEPDLIQAARNLGFDPAKKDGKSVSSIIVMEYEYRRF